MQANKLPRLNLGMYWRFRKQENRASLLQELAQFAKNDELKKNLLRLAEEAKASAAQSTSSEQIEPENPDLYLLKIVQKLEAGPSFWILCTGIFSALIRLIFWPVTAPIRAMGANKEMVMKIGEECISWLFIITFFGGALYSVFLYPLTFGLGVQAFSSLVFYILLFLFVGVALEAADDNWTKEKIIGFFASVLSLAFVWYFTCQVAFVPGNADTLIMVSDWDKKEIRQVFYTAPAIKISASEPHQRFMTAPKMFREKMFEFNVGEQKLKVETTQDFGQEHASFKASLTIEVLPRIHAGDTIKDSNLLTPDYLSGMKEKLKKLLPKCFEDGVSREKLVSEELSNEIFSVKVQAMKITRTVTDVRVTEK